jgi:hypothetical protein
VAFVFVGDVVRMSTRVLGSRSIAQRCDDAGPAGGPERSEGRNLRNKRRASLPAASTKQTKRPPLRWLFCLSETALTSNHENQGKDPGFTPSVEARQIVICPPITRKKCRPVHSQRLFTCAASSESNVPRTHAEQARPGNSGGEASWIQLRQQSESDADTHPDQVGGIKKLHVAA